MFHDLAVQTVFKDYSISATSDKQLILNSAEQAN
jgi:hypothetical protein